MSKTLTERLVAARALVAKLEAAVKAEAILNNIEVGDDVTIKFGRAEKVRHIKGKVVGLNNTDNGLMVAVLSEDFKPYTVHARDVIDNASAEGRAPAASEDVEAAAEAVAEADAAASEVDGDPLAAL